ncbi:MAG: PTS sugar transporter subunit IIA [Lentisphaeria bacterium]|nr:PTS sugar transporter subunit IIA [Lentisphaeria bacterium]
MACDFLNYITRDSVLILDGTDKLQIMDEIISRAADLTKLNRDTVYRLTWKREKMMTTAVGKGLALPHIRVNDIPAPVIIIGVAKNDIADYVAQDGKPVRVIVFMAAPDENQDAYLQLLGSVSRKMREDGVIEKLLESTENAAVLYNTVTAL